jgi:hypothetical protein
MLNAVVIIIHNLYTFIYNSSSKKQGWWETILGQQWMPRAKKILSLTSLGTRAIGSSSVSYNALGCGWINQESIISRQADIDSSLCFGSAQHTK